MHFVCLYFYSFVHLFPFCGQHVCFVYLCFCSGLCLFSARLGVLLLLCTDPPPYIAVPNPRTLTNPNRGPAGDNGDLKQIYPRPIHVSDSPRASPGGHRGGQKPRHGGHNNPYGHHAPPPQGHPPLGKRPSHGSSHSPSPNTTLPQANGKGVHENLSSSSSLPMLYV